jgi:hypothetical protein
MINRGWNSIEDPLYPWVLTVERILHTQELPLMSGPIINIFSDYSGDSKASSYDVISALYLDLYSSSDWEMQRRVVREKYLADGRRVAFKNLGDRQRQKALIPFLQAADQIAGISITLAIRKSIQSICFDRGMFNGLQTKLVFKSKWTYAPFEKMLRVAHLVSLLVAGLSYPNQHIYWISDEDNLFANLERTNDLKQMLEAYSNHYVKHPLGELGLGTTKLDEGDRFEEDMAAIPDLIAGTVAEVVTRISTATGGRIPPNLAVPFYGKFSPKTELLSSWLADETQKLKRIVILFEKLDDGRFAVSKLNMS